MILGILSVRRPHHTTHGKIEPGRAELPFIVSVGGKLANSSVTILFQNVGKNLIDLGIAAPAFFVSESALISHTRNHKTVLDCGKSMLVQRQPGNRPDGSRNEQQTVRISARPGLEVFS